MTCEWLDVGDDVSKCRRCGVKTRRPNIRACKTPCVHLGLATGAVAKVDCTCPGGKSAFLYPIHACAAVGECLPTFVCTAANKRAVKEEWTRSDGGDANVLHPCRGCESFAPASP